VVVHSVPDNSTVVGIPGRVVRIAGELVPEQELDHGMLPDPEAQEIDDLRKRVEQLEEQIRALATMSR
jgi:serine O-acetyltransferase